VLVPEGNGSIEAFSRRTGKLLWRDDGIITVGLVSITGSRFVSVHVDAESRSKVCVGALETGTIVHCKSFGVGVLSAEVFGGTWVGQVAGVPQSFYELTIPTLSVVKRLRIPLKLSNVYAFFPVYQGVLLTGYFVGHDPELILLESTGVLRRTPLPPTLWDGIGDNRPTMLVPTETGLLIQNNSGMLGRFPFVPS
jgi:hypothetical protein